MTAELIDTHCHLTIPPLYDDLARVLLRAQTAGISRILIPSVDIPSMKQVLNLTRVPGLYGALGVHPWNATSDIDLTTLESECRQPGIVAIGEIGLDYLIPVPRDVQKDLFRKQLLLAEAVDLPVILHCRGAFEDMLSILNPLPHRLRGVLHSFSRGPELANHFLRLGMHLSFSGILTRENARRAHEASVACPPDRILIETDAPSIRVTGVNSITSEPAHLIHIAKRLAKLRNCTVCEIAKQTTQNAITLFQLPQSESAHEVISGTSPNLPETREWPPPTDDPA